VENQETGGGIACQICFEVRDEKSSKKVWICEWIENTLSDKWQGRETLHNILG